MPSCVDSCSLDDKNVAQPAVRDGHCLIDNHCYEAGNVAERFGRPCLMCDPFQSSTEWSFSPAVGVDICYIDKTCFTTGDFYSYRASRTETIVSNCQVCSAVDNDMDWSVAPGFALVDGMEPPEDCMESVAVPALPPVEPIAAPTNPPVTTPVATPVAAPVAAPTNAPQDAPVAAPFTAPVAAPISFPTSSQSSNSDIGIEESKTLSGGGVAGIVIASLVALGVIVLVASRKAASGKEPLPESALDGYENA